MRRSLSGHLADRPPAGGREQEVLKNGFALAHPLGVPVVTLHGDVAVDLVRCACEHTITWVVLGHSGRSCLQELFHGSIVNTLTRELRAMDILIVIASPEER